MASTKLFLDMRGKSMDGKGSVLIRIYKNGTSTTVSTGVRVAPENWIDSKVRNVPGEDALNVKLAEQRTVLDRSIALLSLEESFETMTASEVKREILSDRRKNIRSHTVKELFFEYIETGALKEGTKEIYMNTLKKIIAFSNENVKISSINLKWIRSFDQFLSEKQGINGRAIYMRSLRAVCNYARHIGEVTSYPFDNFRIKQEETMKRNIPVEVLREFYCAPVSERDEMYRDYFFLMFFLIGINVKDLLLAKKSQIVGERLEYIREKTNKKYSIKLEPEAIALIVKHSGEGIYLLDAMDHCVHHKSFAREINESIRNIGKSAENGKGILPDITTYYARHTWATLAHELGISSDIISMALGHSPTNKTTFIYIKPDISKVDEANRKVIDFFFSQP